MSDQPQVPDEPVVDDTTSPDATEPPAPDDPAAEEAPTAEASGPETPAADTAAADTAAVDTATEDTTAEATPADPEPAPAAAETPKPADPAPGPVPTPAALAAKHPAVRKPAVPAPVAPETTYDPETVAAATAFGTVTEDGTVIVQDGTQKREVGQYPDVSAEEALAFYARKYLDIVNFLELFEQRLQSGTQTQADINRSLEQMKKHLKEPKVVGDIPALRERAADLRETSKTLIAGFEAERAAAKEQALADRTRFVEEIEALVGQDSERIHWKHTGERVRGMVDEWKAMQKASPNVDHAAEDALWKRLSHARSAFERKRKAFFADLDKRHDEAKQIKEELIQRAESKQHSTDWGPTVRFYRELMNEWKSAPRGHRRTEDQQWGRFRAAQDTFFAARNADLAETDAEFAENLTVKEKILAEAQALLPVRDVDAAKKQLRGIQDRWEAAGKVPRKDITRMENGLKAVEKTVQDAEKEKWRRTDPEARARVDSASNQLHDAIRSYEEDLEKARASGEAKRITQAEEALEARKQWLAVIERNARDLG